MNRAYFTSRGRQLLVALLFATSLSALSTVAPDRAAAQEGEARLLFERGNQHLAEGMRARGRRRQQQLEQALDAYLGVLRLGARTRNVVYNLALTVEALGRTQDAFNYFAEYLAAFDLSVDDRADGERRLEALRPAVAVLEIRSQPPGAAVRVDRRDLPVRGTTPITLAVDPGEHAIFFELDGYDSSEVHAVATLGASATVSGSLSAVAVPVQFIAPSGGTLTLDGAEVTAGRSIPVAPGTHVVRLALEGAPPVERTFEVRAGSDPMTLELAAIAGSLTHLAIEVSTDAEVRLDGLPAGQGRSIDLPTRAGDHVLQVHADGYNPLLHRFHLDTDQRLRLDVSLGRAGDDTGLDVARTVLGITAAVGVVMTATLGALSLSEYDAYNEALDLYRQGSNAKTSAELAADADALEALFLATDITMGITAAFAVTTLILLFVPGDQGAPSNVEIAAGAGPTGGSIALRGRL
ncbi:MAG: PEGA domain-containing protein [Sandaracinaceae bacterium]